MSQVNNGRAGRWLVLAAMALSGGAWAAGDEAVDPWQAAMAAAVQGPAAITLADQAELTLDSGELFIPAAEAEALMVAVGNGEDPTLLGLVMAADDSPWWVTVNYEPEGYISDEDAADWDAAELLDSLREGTEAMNEERAQLGVPALHVVGWVQEPDYDAASHRLIWSVEGQTDGEEGSSINYNTYALGREGYIALNLITDMARIEQDRPVAHALLGRLSYVDGKGYEAFNSDTDQVAAYGLAALVTGVAAKKLGFFAMLAVFAAKYAKLALVAVGVVVAGLGKLFGRKKDQA